MGLRIGKRGLHQCVGIKLSLDSLRAPEKNKSWQFLFRGIALARVGTQKLSPESLRNLLKGLTAGSRPFGKPGPEGNENCHAMMMRRLDTVRASGKRAFKESNKTCGRLSN